MGLYTDRNPPMMSFLWRYLHFILPGYGSIYIVQIALLYLSLGIILKTAESFGNFQKSPYLLGLIFALPWWPQIFLFSIQIQKDNHFTYSFLLAASLLASHTLKKRDKMPFSTMVSLIVLLIYGTGVKYQAQFVLPALTLLIFFSVQEINKGLVPQTRQDHFWQYVKPFDLAAISRSHDQDLIPQDCKTQHYTFDQLKSLFQPNIVDPYVRGIQPHLPSTAPICFAHVSSLSVGFRGC